MEIGHCKEFQSWHFERLPLIVCSDERETLETSALKLFTMANLRYQLSW